MGNGEGAHSTPQGHRNVARGDHATAFDSLAGSPEDIIRPPITQRSLAATKPKTAPQIAQMCADGNSKYLSTDCTD